MGPLASEATTLHQSGCTFSQVCLGFRGCHVPIYIIGLSIVVIRASHRGERCFSPDLLCGPAGNCQWFTWTHPDLFLEPECPPKAGAPEATHSLREKAAQEECLSLSWDLPDFYLPRKQSQRGSIHAGDGSLRRRPPPQEAVVRGQCSQPPMRCSLQLH